MEVKNYREIEAEPVIEEPGVTVRWLVSELEDSEFALRVYEMEPGVVMASHTHYWEHQVFVLAGTGAIVGEERTLPLGEGDIVYVPPAERHQFVNEGDEVLRFLAVIPTPHERTIG